MKIGEMLERGGIPIYEGEISPPPKQLTKEDLLKIIKEKEADIKSLHAEIDKLEKYKALEEGAEAIKVLHTAFMNSGFSDEQAFALVEKMMDAVIKSNAHLFMMI